MSADGTFGLVRWDERFVLDEEDEEGQATCEAGEYLPFIRLIASALAHVVQEFVESDLRRDLIVSGDRIATTWSATGPRGSGGR